MRSSADQRRPVMTARFRVASVVAVIIFTIALMGVGGIPGAVATQDQPVNAGQLNTETKETVVQNITATVSGCAAVPANGLLGCGTWGVEGLGTARGVFGMGSTSGVYGKSDSGTGVEGKTGGENANGVYGNADNSGGSGVYGQNDGTGYGAAGRAINGTGVLGDGVTGVSATGSVTGVSGTSTGQGDGVDGTSNNSCCSAVYGLNNGMGNGVAGRADVGTGVLAASTKGIALKVSGKATFSRSGLVTIPAGTNHATVSLARVTAASMVIATAQQSAGVAVRAAVPADPVGGKFTIYLTGNAPAGGLSVAYFVLN
jgi:hypothetical protein